MPGKMARSGPQRHLDGLECRGLAGPSVLRLPAIHKISNFHVSSGFMLDPVTIALINGLGSMKPIVISHPHFYTTMVKWSRAVGGTPTNLSMQSGKATES